MTVKAETVSIKHGGAVSAVLGFDLTGPPMRAMALGAVLRLSRRACASGASDGGKP